MAEEQTKSAIKEMELEGYKFTVDTDLLDDVEAFEIIDRIENKGQIAAVANLVTFLIGEQGYKDMKAHFTKVDAEAHKDEADYKPRFRLSKLSNVYEVIIANFDPKG